MWIFKSPNDALYISIFMAILAGYIRERYDVVKKNPTGFSKMDWLATFAGGLVMALILFIL